MERFYTLYLRGDPADGVPMAPWQALASAQRWLSALPAAELRARIAADPARRYLAQENETRSPGARSAMAAARASEHDDRDDHDDHDDRDAPPFADPVYWAPYVYVGA
jgi:CHAT domain-containing protein